MSEGSEVSNGAALLFAMDAAAPGTHTFSWSTISVIMNLVFIVGWITCSFFERVPLSGGSS